VSIHRGPAASSLPEVQRPGASALTRRKLAVLAPLAVLVAACGSKPPPPPPPPPPPAEMSGRVQASDNVNPSVSKRPSPVLIRVYELRTATAFNAADFISLFQKDQAELAADLVARDEFMMSPGETRPLTKVLNNDTRFIAVFAAFRDLERATWRAVVPVQAHQKHDITVRADGLVVSATAKVIPPPPPPPKK